MASLFRATSSCDHRSKARFIDSRSCSRKSGLMSCSKLIGSSLAGKSRLLSVSWPNHRPTHQRPVTGAYWFAPSLNALDDPSRARLVMGTRSRAAGSCPSAPSAEHPRPHVTGYFGSVPVIAALIAIPSRISARRRVAETLRSGLAWPGRARATAGSGSVASEDRHHPDRTHRPDRGRGRAAPRGARGAPAPAFEPLLREHHPRQHAEHPERDPALLRGPDDHVRVVAGRAVPGDPDLEHRDRVVPGDPLQARPRSARGAGRARGGCRARWSRPPRARGSGGGGGPPATSGR
jgi:hypothetical protein